MVSDYLTNHLESSEESNIQTQNIGVKFSTFTQKKRLKILKGLKGVLNQKKIRKISFCAHELTEAETMLLGDCLSQTEVHQVDIENIQAKNMTPFIQKLSQPHVKIVRLWGMDSSQNMENLGKSFGNTQVEQIDIILSKSGGLGLCACIEGLKNKPFVKRLSMIGGDLNDIHPNQLGLALKESTITHLYLQANRLLDPNWCLSLIQALKGTPVKHLDFRNNLRHTQKGRVFLSDIPLDFKTAVLESNLLTLKLESESYFDSKPLNSWLKQNTDKKDLGKHSSQMASRHSVLSM